MRIAKVIALTAMVCLISSAAFANLVLDMRAVGVTGSGSLDGAKAVKDVAVGDAITMQIYAQLTGADSAAYFSDFWATIPETAVASGVHGTMSYASGSGAGKIYAANWTGGGPGLLDTGIGTDVAMTDYDNAGFGAAWTGSNFGQVISTPTLIGEFTYTVTGVGTTPASIDIARYEEGYTHWSSTAAGPSDFTADASNSMTGGAVLISAPIIPEPSTLVLLGMGCLALLAIRRRK